MIEPLEARIAPATLRWLGASSGLWSNPLNWIGGVSPASGDTLVFDDGGLTAALVNNTLAGTPYSLVFNASAVSYSLIGNTIVLGGVGLTDSGGGPVTISLSLAGAGGVTQSAGVLTLAAKNTFAGGVTLTGGTLKIQNDGNLGALASAVTITNGATLEALNSLSSPRNFFVGGTAKLVVQLNDTMNLTGLVSDAATSGSLSLTGGGKLILVNDASPFTGTLSVGAGSVEFRGTTTAITGPGTATIAHVPSSPTIASITLAGTNLTSVLTVGSIERTGAVSTTEVRRIISPNGADHIAAIQLNRNIIFGDGVADAVPDLFFAGEATNVTLFDVKPNTILKFGSGLPYDVAADSTTPDTYNNRPNITLRDVLGPGVTIDVTGDGTPAGIGGGGIATLTARNWSFPGLIKTTQSIDSYTVLRGDNLAVLEVDKFHVGALTTANVSTISVVNGKWNSSGTVIEGFVDTFEVGGFALSASLTAGYIKSRFTILGAYLDIGRVALGGVVALTATASSPLFDIRVGSFSGVVNAQGNIGTFTGTGNFTGSLTADSVSGKIEALKFVDNGFTFARITTRTGGIAAVVATSGGITNSIIQSAGDIGAITLTGHLTSSMIGSTISAKGSITGPIKIGTSGKTANLVSSVIVSGAQLGADGRLGGGDDLTWLGGTSIGAISIFGKMTGSSIAASIDPGADFKFGNPYGGAGADTAIGGGGTIGKISLSSEAFTGRSVGTNNSIAHTNAVLGGSIAGVFQIGVTAAKIAAISAANTSRDLRISTSPAASDLLFFTF